jgi:hypothetical protein
MKSIYYVLLIIIIIYFYNKLKNKIIKNIKLNNDILNYDIIYYTGGYYGFYQLGICHYIKNKFKYKNKSSLGISAGSWLSIFMNLDKKYTNQFLVSLFKNIKHDTDISKLPFIFKKTSESFINNINIQKLNILVTNIIDFQYKIHNKFFSINDAIDCCIGSSFVPFITYKTLFYFYNHRLVLDGGVFKKIYINNIDKNKTLLINYKMFGRFTKPKFLKSFRKPSYSLYQLYLLGYNDASKNHEYLKKYF